jgi:hypothetical protein
MNTRGFAPSWWDREDLKPSLDPRRGDIEGDIEGDLEDDASSSKHRSLLSLAGTLLAEVSIAKLAVA